MKQFNKILKKQIARQKRRREIIIFSLIYLKRVLKIVGYIYLFLGATSWSLQMVQLGIIMLVVVETIEAIQEF